MLMFKVASAWLSRIISIRLLGYLGLGAIVLFLFFWRLSTLPPNLAPAEASARTASLSLHNIYSNPIDAPHKLLEYFLLKLAPHSLGALRLSSVIMALLFGFCFYKLATIWFGKLIGLFGSLIFISLPLFVVAGRQGSAQIMLFSPVVLMWLYAWLLRTEKAKTAAWLLLIVASASLFYVPGLIWFIAGGAVICRKRIITSIAGVKPWVSAVGILVLLGILTPLALASISHPAIIKHLLLIPADWQPAVQTLKNVVWMILALFIKAPAPSSLILDRLPLVNVLVLALVVFGVYAMQAAARVKAVCLGLSVMFAIVAAGINNNLDYLALGLPALCLLASAGLRYLYIEWRTIFPRNPVPKTFALLLIAAVTLSQVYFGVRYSLVAWPHSVATRSRYVLK
jgi:hypothetical protein